jgi:hypothetical protein
MDKYGAMQCLYAIEVIPLHKWAPGFKGSNKYQITWKGYDKNEMTWKPATNHLKAKEMPEDYKKQHGLGEIKVTRKRKG